MVDQSAAMDLEVVKLKGEIKKRDEEIKRRDEEIKKRDEEIASLREDKEEHVRSNLVLLEDIKRMNRQVQDALDTCP